MHYPQDPSSLALWPRLLKAAAIDPVLLEALTNLMRDGAQLSLHPQHGGLTLSAGRMTEEAYQEVRSLKLVPRGAKMGTILAQARASTHPWADAIMREFLELEKRCTVGATRLQQVADSREQQAKIVPTLMDRHQFTMLVSTALYQANYAAYWEHNSRHFAAFSKLVPVARSLGIDYNPNGKAWPIKVEEPDGWIWLVTDHGAVCEVDLGKGVRQRQEGEPVLTDGELSDVLARPDEYGKQWFRGKEAG